jgi:hypothetical protein
MAEKLELKEILGWIDNGYKDIWNHLEDEHKKQISFWLLNRYMSSYCRQSRAAGTSGIQNERIL